MTDDSLYVDYDDHDGVVCPRCMGGGTVDCHCGGDLCVCENYGERDCPTCHGEGHVSEHRQAAYFENQRKAFEAMTRAFADAAPGTEEPSGDGVNQA